MSSEPNTTVRKLHLGFELRQLREREGQRRREQDPTGPEYNQLRAAHEANLGQSTLAKYERGENTPGAAVLAVLLRTYGVPEDSDEYRDLTDLGKLARRRPPKHLDAASRAHALWEPMEVMLALENSAESIEETSLVLVSGLLQTERYARAVLQAGIHGLDVEEALTERLARGRAFFDRSDEPVYWVVLREAVLDELIGGPDVMREQLNHLTEIGQRPNVTIQVIPRRAGAHPGMVNSVRLFRFTSPTAWEVAYTDDMNSAHYDDDPTKVAKTRLTLDRIRSVALPEVDSLRLIDQKAEVL